MTRGMLAWCLYDLANTIFAMNMTSYHFPVWVVGDRAAPELAYGLTFGISMLASAAWMPWLGRRSDRRGRRLPAMIGWTLGCVFLTGSLSWIRPLGPALVVFSLANFCYQLAGIFYNAMLPTVAPSARVGRVSGYGVALGYVGTLVGILATAPIAQRWGRQATFFPTALLFLLLALPSFCWIREGAADSPGAGFPPERSAGRPKGDEVRQALRPFLPAAFLGLSVVGTAILFMSVYAKQAVGMTDSELHRVLVGATAVTIAASFLWGRWTDRWGGYRTLGWVWPIWTAAFGLASLSFDKTVFSVVASLAGVALSGTWVASRAFLIERVGPKRVGEAFGLFGLVSRLSAVAGPVLWSLLLWAAAPLGPARYRLAMGGLLACTLVGMWLYRRLGQAPMI